MNETNEMGEIHLTMFRLPLPMTKVPGVWPTVNEEAVELATQKYVRRNTVAIPVEYMKAQYVIIPSCFRCLRLDYFLEDVEEWSSNVSGTVNMARMESMPRSFVRNPMPGPRRVYPLSSAEEDLISQEKRRACRPRIICMVCLGVVESTTRRASCSNNHVICSECTNTWLGVGADLNPLQSTHSKIPCPQDLCHGTLCVQALKSICNERTLSRIEERMVLLRKSDKRKDYCCNQCGTWTAYDFTIRPPPQYFPCKTCGNTLSVRCREWHRYAPFHQDPEEWFSTLQQMCEEESGFTSCPVCLVRVEHMSNCSELVHCNVGICSMCGFHTVPGESEIPQTHWDFCHRYPEDALEAAGENDINKLRKTLHLESYYHPTIADF